MTSIKVWKNEELGIIIEIDYDKCTGVVQLEFMNLLMVSQLHQI